MVHFAGEEMKVLVMMPLYKIMDASCVISLIGFQSEFYDANIAMKFAMCNGFNAAKARRGLVKHAAEETFDYDYALWLDSDHFYKKADFDTLVARMEKDNLSMLSGSYKMRGSNETAHGITDEKGFHHFDYKDFKPGELVECDVVGFGFLVMKRQFIKDMVAQFGDRLFYLDADQNGTEDVTFCARAKEAGHKVMFHPDVRIGHVESALRI